MPVKPKIVTLTNSSIDILNAIRNSASINYQDYVPVATDSPESIREIGAVIMDYPNLQNEFINALVNRIGKVIITSKMYDNPLAMFKQGMLEFGETIEEIFVEIAKAQQFDPETASKNIFKRDMPDVRSAFHVMNYQKFYKKTIQQDQLKQAFLSWDGVTDLISKIVDSMYTGANYDEFLTMKYMLALRILNGQLYPATIPTVETANMKKIVSTIKSTSNALTFMNSKYNLAKVHTHTAKEDQYILMNANFDADVDVEVLASAFNMDKAEFMGKRVLVDSFGTLDVARLDELFADDPTYTSLTDDQLEALNEIPAVLVDKTFFMVFDNYVNFASDFNGEGVYWNYWYHVWKTFSVSPFANSVVFIPATPSVTSITLTPSVAGVAVGGTLQLSCTVVTDSFAPKAVNYSVDKPEKAKVSASGLVTLLDTAVEGDVITVTATSVYDSDITATATITVGGSGGGETPDTIINGTMSIIAGDTNIDDSVDIVLEDNEAVVSPYQTIGYSDMGGIIIFTTADNNKAGVHGLYGGGEQPHSYPGSLVKLTDGRAALISLTAVSSEV